MEITQRLSFQYPAFQLAEKYYSLLCLLNGIHMTEKELQLLTYAAIRGTISPISDKKDFAIQFSSSVASVNNMISKLRALDLIQKIQGKWKVNPKIILDFSKDILLEISLKPKEVNGEP